MAKRYYTDPSSESDEALITSANDPNCKNQQECLEALAARKALKARLEERRAVRAEEEKIRRETVRVELKDNPFDPRHETSADAEYIAKVVGGRIVMHMWIILVALPFVLGVLYAILK